MKKLKRYKFIDDRVFAENIIKSQINNYYGSYAITARLLHKGVARDIIDELLTNEYSREDEIARAQLFCKKKKAAVDSTGSRKGTAKLARMLAARGFPPAVVYTVVRQYDASVVSESD